MPITFRNNAYCAISKKKINVNDKVVAFPPFESSPEAPEFICYDGIALRDEFEKWELKSKVIELVRNEWIKQYQNSKFYTVVYKDNYFLIIKSLLEIGKVRIFFLKKAFFIELNSKSLPEFCEKIRNLDNSRVRLEENTILEWKTNYPNVEIELKVDRGWGDLITISVEEWARLRHEASLWIN